MRQLIRRGLSRVGDSCSPPSPRRRGGSAGNGRKKGHVPVYVGGAAAGEEEEERFVVRAELLAAPALAELLGRAAQEYGYHHHGPLRIPCPAAVFRRALAAAADDQVTQ
jgi:SAUR family protein